MANASLFLSIITFMFVFNGLVGIYAVSQTGIDNDISDMPTIDQEPGLLDYLSYPFEWIFYVGKLVVFTISELPLWLSGIVIALDLTLAFILLTMVRGN